MPSKRQALSEDAINCIDSFIATGELGLSVVPPPSENLSSAGEEGGGVGKVCLLVDKSDEYDWFCSDFRKVNS